jgi:predicted permease
MLLENRNMRWLSVVARLAPEVSLQQAHAFAEVFRMEPGDGVDRILVYDAREYAMGGMDSGWTQRMSWLLLALVGVVIVIACADGAGLMLVRAETQRAEAGIRVSLGASRARLIRDIVFEAMLVSLCAGALGLLLAGGLSQWLFQALARDLPLPPAESLDTLNWRTAAIYIAMMVATTLLCASAAVWRLLRLPLTEVLHSQVQGEVSRFGMREFLVALQVAVSVVMIACALTFLGALRETLAIDPGIALENRAVARINLLARGNFNDTYARLLQAVRDDPRIEKAALANSVPLVRLAFIHDVEPEGHVAQAGEEPPAIEVNAISDGYFDALGIPLLLGGDFSEDRDSRRGMIIVNQAFVDRYWPTVSPLGRTVGGIGDDPVTVIGVVANTVQRELRETFKPLIYLPYEQMTMTGAAIVAKAADPQTAMAALRESTRRVEPDLPLEEMESLSTRFHRFTARDRAMTSLAAVTAGFAGILAVTGIYGIAAFAIRRRRREIGIRYALGASRRQITARFLRYSATVAMAGISHDLPGRRRQAGLDRRGGGPDRGTADRAEGLGRRDLGPRRERAVPGEPGPRRGHGGGAPGGRLRRSSGAAGGADRSAGRRCRGYVAEPVHRPGGGGRDRRRARQDRDADRGLLAGRHRAHRGRGPAGVRVRDQRAEGSLARPGMGGQGLDRAGPLRLRRLTEEVAPVLARSGAGDLKGVVPLHPVQGECR